MLELSKEMRFDADGVWRHVAVAQYGGEHREYRYTLQRRVGDGRWMMQFIMLNPSTATANASDPTVARCWALGRLRGAGVVVVTNLFAYRSTDPRVLSEVADPVGPDNDRWIRRVSRAASDIVVAWGTHGSLRGRGDEVERMFRSTFGRRELWCFGRNRDGSPRHPLYLRKDAKLFPVGRRLNDPFEQRNPWGVGLREVAARGGPVTSRD